VIVYGLADDRLAGTALGSVAEVFASARDSNLGLRSSGRSLPCAFRLPRPADSPRH
jgi:hypothetical protein